MADEWSIILTLRNSSEAVEGVGVGGTSTWVGGTRADGTREGGTLEVGTWVGRTRVRWN